MSLTSSSIDGWLSSIPPKLRDDISTSSNTLVTALSSLFESCSSPIRKTITTSNYNFTYLNASAAALDPFLLCLATSPVAHWSPLMLPANPQNPPLRAKILKCIAWLLDDPSPQPCIESDVCWCVLALALTGQGIPAIWQSLFTLFAPLSRPPQPNQPSADQPTQTPLKTNSGLTSLRTTHAVVDPALRRELDQLLYPDTPGFFEKFFKPQVDAFTETADLRAQSGTGWAKWPRPAAQGPVLEWFFDTTERLIARDGVRRRYYSSRDHPLIGSAANRKTDILLYPTTKNRLQPKGMARSQDNFSWSEILVVGELKQSESTSTPGQLMVQLAGYVREIFHAQHNRRFVHAFTLTNDRLRAWIFHRGGAFGSVAVGINKDPRVFVNVFRGYANMTPQELGFDTGITFDSYNFTMPGSNDKFRIVKGAFFTRKAIASRGTTCWNVQRKGDKTARYVLKDTWRSTKHQSEFELLGKAKGVQGLVEFIAAVDVIFDGSLDDIRGNIMQGLEVKQAMNLRPVTPVVVESPGLPLSANSLASSNSLNLISTSSSSSHPFSTSPATDVTPDQLVSRTRSGTLIRGGPASDSDSLKQVSSTKSSKRPSDSTSESLSKRRRSSIKLDLNIIPPLALVPKGRSEFNRVHTRILMRKGRDLWTFTSVEELLLGLHDAVQAHRSLTEIGILHRDISIFNIMLADPEDPRSDGRRGFLIDLDLAIETTRIQPSGASHRTGTMEFMAIEVLRGETAHTFRHDLESFFYVFIWICVYRSWWHQDRSTPLRTWGVGTMAQAADKKHKNIRRLEDGGYETVEECFQFWAIPLKEVAERWRKALFPVKSAQEAAIDLGTPKDAGLLYDKVLSLLRESVVGLNPTEHRETEVVDGNDD